MEIGERWTPGDCSRSGRPPAGRECPDSRVVATLSHPPVTGMFCSDSPLRERGGRGDRCYRAGERWAWAQRISSSPSENPARGDRFPLRGVAKATSSKHTNRLDIVELRDRSPGCVIFLYRRTSVNITMELASYEVRNYKSIKSSGKINIPGISLILGPNSSGKTNLLESLLLLKQTIASNQSNLKLNGNIIKTGEFANIIRNKNVDNKLSYVFYFDREIEDQDPELICPVCQKEYTYEGYFENHLDDNHEDFLEEGRDIDYYSSIYENQSYIKLEYEFDQESNSNRLRSLTLGYPSPKEGLHLSALEFKNSGDSYEISLRGIKNGEILNMQAPTTEDEQFEVSSTPFPSLTAQIIRSVTPVEDEQPPLIWFFEHENVGDNLDYTKLEEYSKELSDYFEHEGDIEDDFIDDLAAGLIHRIHNMNSEFGTGMELISDFLAKMGHVGPLRNSPRRIYFAAGGSPGMQPEESDQVEQRIFSSSSSQDRELIRETNEWLKQTGFDCQLDVTDVGVGDLYQIEVKQSGLSVNLADAGFGLSQTLPIIIECLNMQFEDNSSQSSRRGVRFSPQIQSNIKLSLIEQPEIHLNPKIEASLGDFFISIAESGVSLLIETHSEHILNRLQRRVAEGEVENSEDINIYFVSKEEGVSNIDRIDISPSGQLSDWPDDFFQDDFTDAMEILKESI